MGIAKCKNVATPFSPKGINTTHQYFQMRYVNLFQLKGLKSYQLQQKCKDCFTKIGWLITFEFLELNQSYTPHLKVLVGSINAFGSQWCGCIVIMCYTCLKLALLLHETILVNFPIDTTVRLMLIFSEHFQKGAFL